VFEAVVYASKCFFDTTIFVIFPWGLIFIRDFSQTSATSKQLPRVQDESDDFQFLQLETTTEINQESQPSEQQLPAAHPPQITQSSSILPYQLPNSSPFLTAYHDFNSISSTTPKCSCEDLFDQSNTSPDIQYLKTFEYSDAFGNNAELERTRLRRANRGHHFYLRNERPKSKSLQSSILQLRDGKKVGNVEKTENNEKIKNEALFGQPQNEILQKFDSGVPISYTSGRVIEPLSSLKIGNDITYEFLVNKSPIVEAVFNVEFGSLRLDFKNCPESSKNQQYFIKGNNTPTVRLKINENQVSTCLLNSLTYDNKFYLPKGSLDSLSIQISGYKVLIPISIKFPEIPVLIDPGTNFKLPENIPNPGKNLITTLKKIHVESMVTIVTKTFERNRCITNLVESIRRFYPNIRIVIADDNVEEKRDKSLQNEKTDHFFMPFSSGWNAGRSLAVSQVQTEYLVWVDDDFLFTETTDLAFWLNFLENMPQYDIVGGRVGEKKLFGYASKLHYDEAGCAARTSGTYRQVEHEVYQSVCQVSDVIQNFYMARASTIRQVGFDNTFKRFAHKEFFLDGKGKLMIASCPNSVIVQHSQADCGSNDGVYGKYRKPTTREWTNVMKRWYFRSNLQCIREKSIMPTANQMNHKRRKRKNVQ